MAGAGGSGAGDPPAKWAVIEAPADHSQIGIGSRVLAEDEAEGGYYPAEVVATKADDHFVLRWADYPDLPEFSQARRALALLHRGWLKRRSSAMPGLATHPVVDITGRLRGSSHQSLMLTGCAALV